MTARLIVADCRDAIAGLPDASVDAVVSDPPYELGFMGKGWDASGIAYNTDVWRDVLRVLKPGGHLLAFGGTRTYHRLACAIEDAGFEIRDSIHWVYGSGFPKSLDVSKAIDKAAGAEREKGGVKTYAGQGPEVYGSAPSTARGFGVGGDGVGDFEAKRRITLPATDDAARWQGWGTALKPAHEPIVVARKPLAGTVAQTVLAHGTGALNIDGCRVGTEQTVTQAKRGQHGTGSAEKMRELGFRPYRTDNRDYPETVNPPGRWPPNFILTHSEGCEEVGTREEIVTTHSRGETTAYAKQVGRKSVEEYGATTPQNRSEFVGNPRAVSLPVWNCVEGCPMGFAESRFFPAFRYQAKASRRERNAGLDGLPIRRPDNRTETGMGHFDEKGVQPQQNFHPTVKPVELMRWLCRLVTPPGGVVLDPFTGSGTTGVAAVMEGFDFIGIEREPEYAEIAERRIAHAQAQLEDELPKLFDEETA